MKSWSWILLIVLTILIKWASWYPEWVEYNYTYGLYPMISKLQRILFGWIPFSLGDLFYGFLVLVVIYKFYRLIRLIWKKQFTRYSLMVALQQGIFFFLFVYVFFNVLWGLNYNRVGISTQLKLEVKTYNTQQLSALMNILHDSVSINSAKVTAQDRKNMGKKKILFTHAREAFQVVAKKYDFLAYPYPSAKPSLFSYAGNYLGFQGYYNPFSGEAQVNTTVPVILQPFVTTHEIAHQLGYAKENEANFVGFLAAEQAPSAMVRYSMYFDMYNYSLREMGRRDSAQARKYFNDLPDQVKQDFAEYREFFRKHRNPLEQVITWGYGHFLKANNQPAGKETYNEVVAWLIAYYRL